MKKILLIGMVCMLNQFSTYAQANYLKPENEISKQILYNTEKLSNWLCEGTQKDRDKAANIFYWITHHIKRDAASFNKEEKIHFRTSNQILKRRKADSDEFAMLLKTMYEYVGIPCHAITGYEKNELYENGAGFYNPNHTWNAAYVEQQWQIIDAFNGAGEYIMDLNWFKKQLQKINKKKLYTTTKIKFKFVYNPTYFLQNPLEVRQTRVPVDPIWQLTDSILPLSIFEQSEQEIKNFNQKFARTKQTNPVLYEISKMTSSKMILECADRTFAYNPRYTAMKAEKHLALAQELLKKVNLTQKLDEVKELINQTKYELNNSKDVLQIQHSEIKKEYDELRKVNSEKKSDVLKYKHSFTDMNRKFILTCKNDAQTAERKITNLKTENNLKRNLLAKINHKNLNKALQHNSPPQEELKQLSQLQDSIRRRQEEIIKNEENIDVLKNKINYDQVYQNQLLDSLNIYIRKTDSSLQKEAIARSKKQDSFDDSVIAIRKNVYYYKTDRIDLIQQDYFDLHDSIQSNYEKIKRLYLANVDINNNNSLDLLTSQKLGAEQNQLSTHFVENKQANIEALNGIIYNNEYQIAYLKSIIPIFKQLNKIYENENSFFDYLTNTEDDRKEYVKNILDKAESIDTKHNTQKKDLIQEYKKDIDKELKSAQHKKKKKA